MTILRLLSLHQLVHAQVAWPASGPELCVVPSTLAVRPQDTCADFGNGANVENAQVDVASQRGEVESAQLLLRRGLDMDNRDGLRNVVVNVSGIPESAAQVEVFQVGFVYTQHSPRYQGSGGGWRPDALLRPPVDTGFDVAPDYTQPLWVQVAVPSSATPGKYSGRLTVSCDGKACSALSVPFHLTVWPVAVPSLNASKIGTAWSGSWTASTFTPYYGDEYWADAANKAAWYDVLLQSRTPPDAIYQGPSSLRDAQDYVYLASKGVRSFAILDVTSLPLTPDGNGETQHDLQDCPQYSDEYVTRLLSTLEPIVAGLEKAGIADRAYIYGFDEQPRSCEPAVRKLFGATKKRWPSLRTAAVLNWSPMPTDLPVDIWILQYQEFNEADAKAWGLAGKEQWQYHCIEPHSMKYLNTFIERRPIQPRLLFWLAALQQLTTNAVSGWLYYAVNLWTPCKSDGCGGAHQPQPMRRMTFNSTTDLRSGFKYLGFTDFPPANYIWQPQYNDIFANGDGQYLYPCEDGPCSTTRLSAIRDGLEDWELFLTLGKKAVPLIQQLVRSPTDWTEDAVQLEAVRRKAAALLMDATPAIV